MSCAHPLAGNQTLMQFKVSTRQKHHSIPLGNIQKQNYTYSTYIFYIQNDVEYTYSTSSYRKIPIETKTGS